MKKILVPTDFSPLAHNALQYAVPLAATLGGEIVLLHVYSPPILSMDTPQEVMTSEIDMIEKVTEERLSMVRKTVHELDERASCKITYRMGDPVTEILNLTEEEGFDLVVMGTSEGSVGKLMLSGSQTAHVAGNARCPVLAIPEKVHYTPFQNLAFATDFRDTGFRVINRLAELANAFGAKITIVHVSTHDRLKDKDLLEWFKELAYEQVSYTNLAFQLLEHEDVREGINVFMLDNAIDLLVISTRKRNFIDKLLHPSQTKKMVYMTKMPLMVYHEDTEKQQLVY